MFKKNLSIRLFVIFFMSLCPLVVSASSSDEEWERQERFARSVIREDLQREEREREDARASDVAAHNRKERARKDKARSDERDRRTMLELDARDRKEKDARRQRGAKEEEIMAHAWSIIDSKEKRDLTRSEKDVLRSRDMTGALAKSIIRTEEDWKKRETARRQEEKERARKEAQRKREREEQRREDRELRDTALASLQARFDGGHFSGQRERDVAEMLRTETIRLDLAGRIISEQKTINHAIRILRANREGGRYSEEELKGVRALLTPTDHRMVLTCALAEKIVRSQKRAEKWAISQEAIDQYADEADIEKRKRHQNLFGAPPVKPKEKDVARPSGVVNDPMPKPTAQAAVGGRKPKEAPKKAARTSSKPERTPEEIRALQQTASLRERFPTPTSAHRVEGSLFHDKALAETEDPRALEWMTTAAQWNATARYNLGYWYANGKEGVVEKDLDQAIEWYEVGGLLDDNLKSQYNLALLYRENPDYKDDRKYIYWLQRAAADADGRTPSKTAQFRLGEVYEQGLDVIPACMKEALKWYKKSAVRGNEDAADAVRRLEQ
jgi:TPR repeat protein